MVELLLFLSRRCNRRRQHDTEASSPAEVPWLSTQSVLYGLEDNTSRETDTCLGRRRSATDYSPKLPLHHLPIYWILVSRIFSSLSTPKQAHLILRKYERHGAQRKKGELEFVGRRLGPCPGHHRDRKGEPLNPFSTLPYLQQQDRKLIRKLDWKLLPWVSPNLPRFPPDTALSSHDLQTLCQSSKANNTSSASSTSSHSSTAPTSATQTSPA